MLRLALHGSVVSHAQRYTYIQNCNLTLSCSEPYMFLPGLCMSLSIAWPDLLCMYIHCTCMYRDLPEPSEMYEIGGLPKGNTRKCCFLVKTYSRKLITVAYSGCLGISSSISL